MIAPISLRFICDLPRKVMRSRSLSAILCAKIRSQGSSIASPIGRPNSIGFGRPAAKDAFCSRMWAQGAGSYRTA